jgi:hypothetical protein
LRRVGGQRAAEFGRSEWWIIPTGTGRSVWSRRHSAICRHCSTKVTSLVVEADQPTIAREHRMLRCESPT